MRGKKTGGRTKGTPNKNSLAEVKRILEQSGVNPLRRMIDIAKKTENDALAGRMWAEIAKYRYQQLKAIEVSGDPEKPIYLADADARRRRIEELQARLMPQPTDIIVVDAE